MAVILCLCFAGKADAPKTFSPSKLLGFTNRNASVITLEVKAFQALSAAGRPLSATNPKLSWHF
jgi:hypothetical protein